MMICKGIYDREDMKKKKPFIDGSAIIFKINHQRASLLCKVVLLVF